MGTDRSKSHVPLIALGGTELRDRIAGGAVTAEDAAAASLAQIAGREPEVQAWAHLDSDHVLAQATQLDKLRRTGRPVGALHGLPVGIKDIIDVAGMPTANGTPLDAGKLPKGDAGLVGRLRSAGANVVGKTVTTELAFMHPSKTRNPVNTDHTPGGSSAGSAAAVASGMVPLAVGTQTGGSVIRPAAYCGCVGYKPSFGMIGRSGVLSQSPSLDTIGVFARSVEDAAMLAEVLCGHDPQDPATAHLPPPRLLDTCLAPPPVTPTLAVLAGPPGVEIEAPMADAMATLYEALGERAFEITLPGMFAEARAVRERIHFAEMSKTYYHYHTRGPETLSPEMTEAMAAGREITARDYIAALDWTGVLNAGLDEIFARCDAIVTPATTGPAPRGFETTGNPVCNGVWTLAHVPAITLPLFETESGLPLGIQLIGRRGDDARLLRTARWLAREMTQTTEGLS